MGRRARSLKYYDGSEWVMNSGKVLIVMEYLGKRMFLVKFKDEDETFITSSDSIRLGSVIKKHVLYGVGINDAGYPVQTKAEGVVCKYYLRWRNMLSRCYSKRKGSCYNNVTVCEDWLLFSNFKVWMKSQEKLLGSLEGYQLDKDLLFKGNKEYSPENCIFLLTVLNNFIADGNKDSVGTCLVDGKYQAKCFNPFTKQSEYLGVFDNKTLAHEAWRNRKSLLAVELLNYLGIKDKKIRNAIIGRYK